MTEQVRSQLIDVDTVPVSLFLFFFTGNTVGRIEKQNQTQNQKTILTMRRAVS